MRLTLGSCTESCMCSSARHMVSGLQRWPQDRCFTAGAPQQVAGFCPWPRCVHHFLDRAAVLLPSVLCSGCKHSDQHVPAVGAALQLCIPGAHACGAASTLCLRHQAGAHIGVLHAMTSVDAQKAGNVECGGCETCSNGPWCSSISISKSQ